MSNGFVCTLSDDFVTVEHKGRKYNFEHTAWCGWACTTQDHQGAKRDHPRGAWLELQKLHPEINV